MAKDLTGLQFSNWLVVSFSHKDSKRNYWDCECQCEKKTRRIIDTYPLVHKKRKSCGCLPRVDITNEKFGKWKVLEFSHMKGRSYWICQCDCGTMSTKRLDQLTAGITRDCGCSNNFNMDGTTSSKEVGEMDSRIASIWYGMHHRCQNKDHINYSGYGGRGISICKDWYYYDNFKDWAMKNGYSDDLELDRIDNDGNYNPSNCRWATREQQCYNKRNTIYIEYKGKKRTLKELSELTGITIQLLQRRHSKGFPVNDITSPYHLRAGKKL